MLLFWFHIFDRDVFYDTNQHRQIYSNRVKRFREKVDFELEKTSNGDKLDEIYYSNIFIAYGEREDKRLPVLGVSYHITIGTFIETSEGMVADSDPTFCTNFK